MHNPWPRLVLVRAQGKGETPWSAPSILINGLGSMAKAYNYEGENQLRASKQDVEYTIIRVSSCRPRRPESTTHAHII